MSHNAANLPRYIHYKRMRRNIAARFCLLAACLLAGLPALSWAQSTGSFPQRNVMVTGGQFTIETYIDVGPLSAPVFPLDDRGTFANPRVSSKRCP